MKRYSHGSFDIISEQWNGNSIWIPFNILNCAESVMVLATVQMCTLQWRRAQKAYGVGNRTVAVERKQPSWGSLLAVTNQYRRQTSLPQDEHVYEVWRDTSLHLDFMKHKTNVL